MRLGHWHGRGGILLVWSLAWLLESALAQPVPWQELSGELLLRDAQLLIPSSAGAYAIGWNQAGEVQANDLVRGGEAWKKPGVDFAVHARSGRVAVRQLSGFVRMYDVETGRFLLEHPPENAALVFREEGSGIPVLFAISAGMLPAAPVQYVGEAMLSRGLVCARLRSGELLVAEQASGRELLRVFPFVSGNGAWEAPDGIWGGSEGIRRLVEQLPAGSGPSAAWDGGLACRVFGDPGPAPPGVDVAAGPWRILTREFRDGLAIEKEWSYWLQESGSGRITGRGNLVGLNGAWASGEERGTWSGLQLRLERDQAWGDSEEKVEGEVLRRPEWRVRFAEDGRSFRGVEQAGGGMPVEVEGAFSGEPTKPGAP